MAAPSEPLTRERLTAPFAAGSPPRFSVLAAPAGYGKSILVEQWLAALGRSGVTRVKVGLLDGPDRLRARLATAAAACGDDHVLVVDASRGAPVDDVAGQLELALADLPPAIPVVLEVRGPWATERRAQPDLLVDATALSFTPEELRAHVAATCGHPPDDGALAELVARTGGWPLAVRLVARLLADAGDRGAVLRAVRGAERHIAAFLGEEVLGRHEPRLRTFLLQTSVLGALTADGCRAVTDDPASDELLDLLVASGTVLPAEHDGAATAVHPPMLRDFLHDELRVDDKATAIALEARAVGWWAASGDLARAADQCIAAELWPTLLDLADRFGPTLFERGQPRELLRWLDAVPTPTAERRKQIGIRRGFVFSMLGESRRAEATLGDLGDVPLTPVERVLVDGLRATWVFHDADRTSVAALADAALEALDQFEPGQVPDLLGLTHHASLVTMLRGARGRSLWYGRDLDGARADLGAIVAVPTTYPVWHVHAHGTLALIEAWAGNLVQARELANRGLSLAGDRRLLEHPATLEVRAALAHIHRERGELDLAAGHLDELLATALRTRRPTSLAIHAVERGLWHLAAGRPDQGVAALDAERMLREVPPPDIVVRRRQAVEARLHLALDDLDTARRQLARAIGASPIPPELRSVAVQCELAAGDAGAARAALDVDPTGAATERKDRLEHDLLRAAVDLLEGDRRSAIDRARRVVAEATTDGQRRLFLDLGPQVEAVLRAVLRVEPSPHLTSVLGTPGGSRPARPGPAALLSDREVDVVRYLPTPLTNAEIAAQLYISLNTLKSHLASIYRKLGVADRRGAIARAEELGLA